VRGDVEPNRFLKRGVGVEGGIRFEGKFESLTYSYDTTVGGYHRADLVLAHSAGSQGFKVGTIYTVQWGDYVRMFSINAYIKLGGGVTGMLEYPNHRPIPHKLLAWVGFVPELILFSPVIIIGALGGDID